jgi:hypothetical protein
MASRVVDILKATQGRIAAGCSFFQRAYWLPRRQGPKIFGIGYPKTGTTTLGACFRELGFKHQSCDMELAVEVVQNRLANAFRIADRHDSFEDWPWFRIYRELDLRYPGSRFVLTVRQDTATYLTSLKKHQERQGLNRPGFRKPNWWDPIFGSWGSDYECRASLYEQHNRQVQEYFRDRTGDLLVVCWERGDGWEKLCAFLEKPIPGKPFPHLNRSDATALLHQRPCSSP